MNATRQTVLGIVLALFSSLCNAQSLWNGTEYGMTVNQVTSRVPGASPPSTLGHLADGSEELLRLENIDIVGKLFSAAFFFKSERLVQVTLSLEKGNTFHSATLTFNSLVEALRSKYGNETSNDELRGLLNKKSATWMSGRTNVNLLAIGVGQSDATLNVNYQVRVAREADKL